MKSLYLYHSFPEWYQFLTATFCHGSWNHLSSNLFFLYIFGKLVEEEEGNFALWLSYILTGVGANLVSWLILPRNAVSIGASGAVFGLFTISVLVKMSWDWRKILEVLILGQFVVEKVSTSFLYLLQTTTANDMDLYKKEISVVVFRYSNDNLGWAKQYYFGILIHDNTIFMNHMLVVIL
uniref:Peptidase S54 rhomboid domain-containing protein n=1 Tax=Cannabis sativa TaxID=3483 RepID=A0A803QUD6_CANSA